MIAETIPELRSLSQDQKIILAAELWRDAVGESDDVPNPSLIEALRERLSYYNENPGDISTWDAVRARILSIKRP